jgi:hypothetical protein
MAKRGRPRKEGEREPNGRLSRRGMYREKHPVLRYERRSPRSPREVRRWAQISEGNALAVIRDRPRELFILRLAQAVNRGEASPKSLWIAPYWIGAMPEFSAWRVWWGDWICPDLVIDLHTDDGCTAARRVIEITLGKDVVDRLDQAVLESRADVASFSVQLQKVCEIWCHRS